MLPSIIQTAQDRIVAIREKIAFLGPTLARLTVGLVFIGTGWGKLHTLPDVTEYFASLHIPAPALQARIAASTEFFGGILVLIGLFARVASVPLGFTMVVAILTAKRAEIDGLSSLVGFEEWSYLVFFIWIALAGAGPLSIDGLLKRLRGGGHKSPPAAVTT